jgi:hypothetical protein
MALCFSGLERCQRPAESQEVGGMQSLSLLLTTGWMARAFTVISQRLILRLFVLLKKLLSGSEQLLGFPLYAKSPCPFMCVPAEK